jgi:hypothetical protein
MWMAFVIDWPRTIRAVGDGRYGVRRCFRFASGASHIKMHECLAISQGKQKFPYQARLDHMDCDAIDMV